MNTTFISTDSGARGEFIKPDQHTKLILWNSGSFASFFESSDKN